MLVARRKQTWDKERGRGKQDHQKQVYKSCPHSCFILFLRSAFQKPRMFMGFDPWNPDFNRGNWIIEYRQMNPNSITRRAILSEPCGWKEKWQAANFLGVPERTWKTGVARGDPTSDCVFLNLTLWIGFRRHLVLRNPQIFLISYLWERTKTLSRGIRKLKMKTSEWRIGAFISRSPRSSRALCSSPSSFSPNSFATVPYPLSSRLPWNPEQST